MGSSSRWEWFRATIPYIHAHNRRCFVLCFPGDDLLVGRLPWLMHDIALLHSLGVRLLLVPMAEQLVAQRLQEEQQTAAAWHRDRLLVTRDQLACVLRAVGDLRVALEAQLSVTVTPAPRLLSGNLLLAQPVGVIGGHDYGHSGQIRRVEHAAIGQIIDQGGIVLLPPVGYSMAGETFLLDALEVAAVAAQGQQADKLIVLQQQWPPLAGQQLPALLSTEELRQQAAKNPLSPSLSWALDSAQKGVVRCHLLPVAESDSLLAELYSRDGCGLMISADDYESLRPATAQDIGGILALLSQAEQEGYLVQRSREQLELDIAHFLVLDLDGLIIACAALYPDQVSASGELAALVVHPLYRGTGRAGKLIAAVEAGARQQGLRRLFVLSTRALHFFIERNFIAATLADLPVAKRQVYNYQRRAHIFIKTL